MNHDDKWRTSYSFHLEPDLNNCVVHWITHWRIRMPSCFNPAVQYRIAEAVTLDNNIIEWIFCLKLVEESPLTFITKESPKKLATPAWFSLSLIRSVWFWCYGVTYSFPWTPSRSWRSTQHSILLAIRSCDQIPMFRWTPCRALVCWSIIMSLRFFLAFLAEEVCGTLTMSDSSRSNVCSWR